MIFIGWGLLTVLIVSLAMPLAAVKPWTSPGSIITATPCAGEPSGFKTSICKTKQNNNDFYHFYHFIYSFWPSLYFSVNAVKANIHIFHNACHNPGSGNFTILFHVYFFVVLFSWGEGGGALPRSWVFWPSVLSFSLFFMFMVYV